MPANRLSRASSPYLLQHANNPVDWYPWGEEAFAKARAEDKPIFLSVGYSACHWCHVMAHESFEHEEVAALLNANFVSLKVDREERPDLDDIYMTATQLMSGRGGWPNSVWMTPDGRPFYAGTYFPREDRGGHPGFTTLLKRVAQLWRDRRGDVEEQATQLAGAIRANASASRTSGAWPDNQALRLWIGQCEHQLESSFDLRHGGFGSAPKFPPHAALAFLLQRNQATSATLLTGTLDAMLAGGIHDQVGGGFHRYSTDERWFLPHFEKMLYDNAQLARNYAVAFSATRSAAYAETARDTLDWILREMSDPAGGFHSALDADSEGEEGRFYVWSRDEIIQVLGDEDGSLFCRAYGVEPQGNYREEASGQATGLNIPHRTHEFAGADAVRLASCRARLLETRNRRVWPGRDDKVLTSWNGLTIGALATAGRILDESRYVHAAEKSASFITASGPLRHSYRDGQWKIAGFLDDYASLADGLLDLHETTGKQRWLDEAASLAQIMIEKFCDGAGGGFFYTSHDQEPLIVRTKDVFDQAAPSGNGVAARVFLRLGQHTGNQEFVTIGGNTVKAFAPALERMPTGACGLITAAALFLEAESKRQAR